MVAAADPGWRDCPRAKCTSDLPALADLRKTHALSIIRYQAQSDVEEPVRLNRAFLVDLAALTPRVPAPPLAKAAKDHSPELSKPERASWANAAKQAMQHCYKHKDVKKLAPATAAVARALQQRGREGAPTLPIDARPKPSAAPAGSPRGPALRSPPSASEIAAVRGHSGTPRAPTKRASAALGSPGQNSSAAPTTTRRRLTRKQSLVDLPTAPAAEKPAPKRASVREVDCNRIALKKTDDSAELREFDLKGARVAILADGATWTSEITGADSAARMNPPVNEKPAITKTSGNNEKPAAATGAWRVDGEDLTMGADEDNDAKRELTRAMKGMPPKPAAAKAKPAAAELKAKPAAAELPKAKPAAADPGNLTDEK
ncbi:unnamed protein product, partial [Prorocentrum cordatum]